MFISHRLVQVVVHLERQDVGRVGIVYEVGIETIVLVGLVGDAREGSIHTRQGEVTNS